MTLHRSALEAALIAFVLSLLAAPAAAQISAKQIQDRYKRNTEGKGIDDFVRKMDSDDPEQRLQGLKSLSETDDPRAIEYLLQALGDDDVRVKAKAIDALGRMRATEATPVLIQHLFLRSTQPTVKRRILAALGQIGDPRATRPIVEFLRRDLDDDTCGTAIYALGDIGSPEAMGKLQEIAKDDGSSTLRRLARQAQAKVRYHQAMLETEAKEPQNTFLSPDQLPQAQ
jgi:HEAT repeat protein